MGEHDVDSFHDPATRRAFARRLLKDLRALDHMVRRGMIESTVRRVGAEQEMFLVDHRWRPANAALDVLADLDDRHFTTELGLFNIELNLDPIAFGDGCLHAIEEEVAARVSKLAAVAERRGLMPVLTGILPTLRVSDLGLHSMVPAARYFALNDALARLRGGPFEVNIRGTDELILQHDSVMMEACNASFQVHFQVSADEFPRLYNASQIAAAPVLAASANSPLLFGRRLWHETRIALFQQSVDNRRSLEYVRERAPRVTFGTAWVRQSPLELYRDDITRFPVLLGVPDEEDSLAELAAGRVPHLRALCTYNSTVYRWNRACYGVTAGVPHLRIENRMLPAGPTILDEVASAAFWFGLIGAISDEEVDPATHMRFEDARENFRLAASLGLRAPLTWYDGTVAPAGQLIQERLLPAAATALEARGIERADIDRYLGVVSDRVASGRTGATWILDSLRGLGGAGEEGVRLSAITAAIVRRGKKGGPVTEWEPAQLSEAGGWRHNLLTVEQYMSTEMFTVREDEPVEVVASLMEWRGLRHVAVEDSDNHLVGLVSYRALLRLLATGQAPGASPLPVSEIMARDLITVTPETTTMEAIELMRSHAVGALPVVTEGRLVGIVTERSFMNIARELLEEMLGMETSDADADPPRPA